MALNRHLMNSKDSYGWINIAVHWVMALMILGMYPLGLYIVSLGYYDPGYRIYPNLHRSLGIIVAILLLVRLGWRVVNPTPRSLAQQPWEKWAAHSAHLLLYVLLVIVVASGYFISTADGRSIQVFDWFQVPASPWFRRQEELAGMIHFYAATTMMVLVAMHFLAALKHHFITKDWTLKRMLGVNEENTL